MPPIFHVVLHQPEIPNNTGNIGRTALATGCRLHVVHPAGFDMGEKALRRAGLDYWRHVDCVEHPDWDAFLAREQPARMWLFTTKARRTLWEGAFQRGDYLLFGRETRGIDDDVHEWFVSRHGDDRRLSLPMVNRPEVRSLNLATAVCAVIYEGWRQVGFDNV